MKQLADIDFTEGFLAGERIALLINRMILVLMMGCLMVGIVNLGHYIVPGWNGSYLPWLAMLVALEATYTLGQVRRSRDLEMSVLTYRFVEAVVLLISLKIIFYFIYGWDQLLSDARFLVGEFLYAFLDAEYLFAALVLAGIWGLSTKLMNDLFEIETALTLLNAEGYEKYFSDCAAIRSSLASQLLWIGLSMVAMVGLANFNLERVFAGRITEPVIGTWNVLVYFALLMLMLSLTYFSTLRAGWAWERIPLDRKVAIRWLGYIFLALAGIGGVVALLPTQYSMGFLTTLNYILQLLLSLITSVALFFYYLLAQLLILLISLFGGKQRPENVIEEIPEVEIFEAPPAMEQVSGSELLQSIVFWAIFTFIIIFAFSQYLKQNKILLTRLREFSLWRFLEQSWHWLAGWVKGVSKEMRGAVRGGISRLRNAFNRRAPAQRFNFINMRKLSPRQQVLFFYLALVRRGEEAGFPRKPAQTPIEYEKSLVEHLPPAQDDQQGPPKEEVLEKLTQSFQEARYSQHTITAENAGSVKAAWNKIRKILQQVRESSRKPT